jgi:hypothetical protein
MACKPTLWLAVVRRDDLEFTASVIPTDQDNTHKLARAGR